VDILKMTIKDALKLALKTLPKLNMDTDPNLRDIFHIAETIKKFFD
jgi:hypothetical protein